MKNLIMSVLLLVQFGASQVTAAVIYSNDFNDADALNDFFVGEMNASQVEIQQGQVAISPGSGFTQRGFITLDIRDITGGYDPVLRNNSEVSWAFNISNADGRLNNRFGFEVFSSADPSDPAGFGYSLTGGGWVGDRMVVSEGALAKSVFGSVFNILIDEPNGLSTRPDKGAFRISYSAQNSLWSFYFESASDYIDPLTVDTLIGQASASLFVDEALPFMILNGYTTGTTYIDNFSVSFSPVPLPPAIWLLATALIALFGAAHKRNKGVAR